MALERPHGFRIGSKPKIGCLLYLLTCIFSCVFIFCLTYCKPHFSLISTFHTKFPDDLLFLSYSFPDVHI